MRRSLAFMLLSLAALCRKVASYIYAPNIQYIIATHKDENGCIRLVLRDILDKTGYDSKTYNTIKDRFTYRDTIYNIPHLQWKEMNRSIVFKE